MDRQYHEHHANQLCPCKLIINRFRITDAISAGTIDGLNNKAKLTTRKSYGFRTSEAIETALYHNLGALPEPECTHRFC